LKKNHIHVAIQTSGVFDLSEFKEKLLPHIDLIYFDIKLFDPHKHKTYTGRSNEEILGNFTELYNKSGVTVVPTIPLVPNITATEHNLTSIAKFLKAAGCFTYELKPYNPGGISKRVMIGEDVPQDISEIPMKIEEQERMKAIFDFAS
jgi:pyruvate formate lyase activating enzyme